MPQIVQSGDWVGSREARRILAALVLLTVVCCLIAAGNAQGFDTVMVRANGTFDVEVARGEFLIRFLPGISAEQRRSVLQTFGLKEILYRPDVDYAKTLMQAVEPDRREMEACFDRLGACVLVKHVEYNVMAGISPLPAHPVEPGERRPAPVVARSSSPVIIALLDTGVAYRDEDDGNVRYFRAPGLEGVRFVDGRDLLHDDGLGLDDHGHGTHVAQTIVQAIESFRSSSGLEIDYALMPVKVFDRDGRGTLDGVVGGVVLTKDENATIIQLGGDFPLEAPYSLFLEEALSGAAAGGALPVGGAGDHGLPMVSLPAAYPDVVAVASVQSAAALAPYSNFGPSLDLCAFGGPGADHDGDGLPEGIVQTTVARFDPMAFGDVTAFGTTHAAAKVTALAALLFASGERDPETVRLILADTADHPDGPGRWDEEFGFGVIDPDQALSFASRR